MSHWVKFERVQYARDMSHHDIRLMEDLVTACHILWNKYLPMWDQLYMLNVLSYGELQRQYRRQTRHENDE
jgi:hypothetical protein